MATESKEERLLDDMYRKQLWSGLLCFAGFPTLKPYEPMKPFVSRQLNDDYEKAVEQALDALEPKKMNTPDEDIAEQLQKVQEKKDRSKKYDMPPPKPVATPAVPRVKKK